MNEGSILIMYVRMYVHAYVCTYVNVRHDQECLIDMHAHSWAGRIGDA